MVDTVGQGGEGVHDTFIHDDAYFEKCLSFSPKRLDTLRSWIFGFRAKPGVHDTITDDNPGGQTPLILIFRFLNCLRVFP